MSDDLISLEQIRARLLKVLDDLHVHTIDSNFVFRQTYGEDSADVPAEVALGYQAGRSAIAASTVLAGICFDLANQVELLRRDAGLASG